MTDERAFPPRIWTVGHSNLDAQAFVVLLRSHGIRRLADVRRYPASRRNPQFGREALRRTLENAGIAYSHFPDLGGHRQALPDSPNAGWPQSAFRGYADYMATPDFDAALEAVLRLAADARVALMCAEKDWRHCHRGLIADALKCRGHDVVHIAEDGLQEPHPYTGPARVRGNRLSYPAREPPQAAFDFQRDGEAR